jgi:S1-C subfamily serine protease
MRRTPFLGAMACVMAALPPAGPLLRAEDKKEVRPRLWAVDVLKKIRPAVVIVEERRQDADGEEVRPRSWLGILLDPKGVVVMPRRLSSDAARIEVVLSDGRRFIPKAVVSDPEAELTVLRLEDDKPLPAAAFGDSDSPKVGDWVLSLDCMFGEVSFELGLFTGKARAGKKGAGRLHMDSCRSCPCDRDLLLDRKGEIIGIWAGRSAVPAERVKETVRRLLASPSTPGRRP